MTVSTMIFTDLMSLVMFAVAMVASPGPANMVLLSAGARFGFVRALPFCIGVIFGMQFIVWSIGFGILKIADSIPWLYTLLGIVSAIYILWLAWKISLSTINPKELDEGVPGFAAGLIVHPLNPKAWVIVTGAFANFATLNASALSNMIKISIVLLIVQSIFQTLWCSAGGSVAKAISGRPVERWAMGMLGVLTVISVVWSLLSLGG